MKTIARAVLLLCAMLLVGTWIGAMLLSPVASETPPGAETVCRQVLVTEFDPAAGNASILVGPPALRDSSGAIGVPAWPYGVLCSAGDAAQPPSLQFRATPPTTP